MFQIGHRASRVPRRMGLCMPGVFAPARSAQPSPYRSGQCCLPRVRSASAPEKRPISGLNTLPAHAPVNASLTPLPRPAHDSGSVWVAHPSLSGTFTLQHPAGLSRHTPTLGVSRAGYRVGCTRLILIEAPSSAYRRGMLRAAKTLTHEQGGDLMRFYTTTAPFLLWYRSPRPHHVRLHPRPGR